MKIMLTVSYDGTNYCGWQVQPNADTVQERIEKAIFAVTGESVRVTGSGRTDSGVHANGQTAHCTVQKDTIPAQKYARALNAYLPNDIRALKSVEVLEEFDACRTAKKKTYKYSCYISEIELPLKERYAVRLDKGLDIELMKKGALSFLGEHDFKGFCATGSSIKTTVRTIYALDIDYNGLDLTFRVTGNGFLYNMVRIIVGTLVKLGERKCALRDIEQMLISGNRDFGGKTVPAKGLCLESVEY